MATGLFQKDLSDLIKGIRSNKKNEAQYISKAMFEIKNECKSTDIEIKAIAISKLTFLQMMGYDMSWAAFYVLEVMSHPQFGLKRSGYLAAAQSFNEDTDIMLLTTNQFKKDLTSPMQFDVGVALNALSNVVTPDLGRDLVSDVAALLNNSHPYVRKKAVLMMYKCFLKYPEALRPSFPRLKEKFEDTSLPVVSATVNVICELARKNPSNYLSLAPTLYKLLTGSTNNWMLIKIIKLFGALAPLEPRLAKKLVDPLTNIINTTPAKSVLYECINTCCAGLAAYPPVIKLCAQKLGEMLQDPDPNLKYLGLLGLPGILAANGKLEAEHKDTILKCLGDDDVTIRLRALELLDGLTTRKNLQSIVTRLKELVSHGEGEYRDKLIAKIINLCSANAYANMTDFEWYISVLIDLAKLPAMQQGRTVSAQMLDVAVRVPTVRSYCVHRMMSLLKDTSFSQDAGALSNSFECLYAAAYIVGEYSDVLKPEDYGVAIQALLRTRNTSLPAHITAIFVQNALKLYARASASDIPEEELIGGLSTSPAIHDGVHVPSAAVESLSKLMKDGLKALESSVNVEVQERACSALKLVDLMEELRSSGRSFPLSALFEEELKPVASGAVKKVPVPEGLDLDAWIYPAPRTPEPSDAEDDKPDSFYPTESYVGSGGYQEEVVTPEEQAKRREEYQRRRENDPYYLPSKHKDSALLPPVDDIPVQRLSAADLKDEKKEERKHKHRHRKDASPPPAPTRHTVIMEEDAPVFDAPAVTAVAPKKGSKAPVAAPAKPRDAIADRLNIDLSAPLDAHEVLPTIEKYPVKTVAKDVPAPAPTKEEEKKHRSSKHRHGDGEKGERKHRSHREKDEKKEQTAPAKGGNLLIDFGFDEPTAPAPKAADYSQMATPPKDEKPKEEERKHRSSRHKESERDSKHHHRSHRDGEKEKSSFRSEKPSSTTSASAPSSTKTSSAPRPDTPQMPARMPTKKRMAVAGKDENILVSYNLSANASAPSTLVANITVKNLTDNDIGTISLDASDTLNLRLTREKGASIQLNGIDALSDTATTVNFSFKTYDRAQKMTGSITYNYKGKDIKTAVTFIFPCAAYITPTSVSTSEFASVMSGSGVASGSSVRVPRGTRSWREVEDTLAMTLNSAVVESQDGVAAALFGRTLAGQPIAVLVKADGSDVLKIDVKSADDTLSTALTQEVVSIFGRL